MPRHSLTEQEIADFRAIIQRHAIVIAGEVGLAGLSMRKLADSLNLTAGALYRYYPSKRELIFDCSAEALRALKARFAEHEASQSDPLATIRAMLHAYADFALEDKDRFRLIFLEDDQGATSSLEADAEAMAPYFMLQAQVVLAVEGQLIGPADPSQVTNMFWASIHGIVTLACTLHTFDLGNIDSLIDSTITNLMRGLSPQGVSQ
jgi:AcrR family transcriptional regulator